MKTPFPSLTETYHKTSYDAISPTRPELSVAHKTVIVTGGGRGIGAEIARAYAAAGASRVVLIGRTQTTLSQTAEKIKKDFSSVSVTTHTADVADEAAIGKAAEKVGKWDVLILNAGLLADPLPIEKSNIVDWWRVFEVRLIFHIFWPLLSPPPSPTIRNLWLELIRCLPDQRERSDGNDSCLPPLPKRGRLYHWRQRRHDYRPCVRPYR